MRIPSWLAVALAIIVAIPFGWVLGVFVARLIAGPDFGVLPVLTIPPALAAAIVFARSSFLTTGARFAVLVGGTALLALLA
jgi:hypothetical protein